MIDLANQVAEVAVAQTIGSSRDAFVAALFQRASVNIWRTRRPARRHSVKRLSIGGAGFLAGASPARYTAGEKDQAMLPVLRRTLRERA